MARKKLGISLTICLFLLGLFSHIQNQARCDGILTTWSKYCLLDLLSPYKDIVSIGRGNQEYYEVQLSFHEDCQVRDQLECILKLLERELQGPQESTKDQIHPHILGSVLHQFMDIQKSPTQRVAEDQLQNVMLQLEKSCAQGTDEEKCIANLLYATLLSKQGDDKRIEQHCKEVFKAQCLPIFQLKAKWVLADFYRKTGKNAEEEFLCKDIIRNYPEYKKATSREYARKRIKGEEINRFLVP